MSFDRDLISLLELTWSEVLLGSAVFLAGFVGTTAAGVILAMPGVPGPGILTILIAITLLDFPGKRRLELWLVSRPPMLRAVNRLRARFGKPALLLDDPSLDARPGIRSPSASE